MNTYEYQLTDGTHLSPPRQIKAPNAAAVTALAVAGFPIPVQVIAPIRLVAVAPGPRVTIYGEPDDNFTVEEASRFLTCWQPVSVGLLGKLGKDCSMVCRIRNASWTERPTPAKAWLKERAYPFDIIREVFELNPETAPYIPKGDT